MVFAFHMWLTPYVSHVLIFYNFYVCLFHSNISQCVWCVIFHFTMRRSLIPDMVISSLMPPGRIHFITVPCIYFTIPFTIFISLYFNSWYITQFETYFFFVEIFIHLHIYVCIIWFNNNHVSFINIYTVRYHLEETADTLDFNSLCMVQRVSYLGFPWILVRMGYSKYVLT